MGVMILAPAAVGDREGGKIDIAIEIGMRSMSLGGVEVGVVGMRTSRKGIGGMSEFCVRLLWLRTGIEADIVVSEKGAVGGIGLARLRSASWCSQRSHKQGEKEMQV